MKLDELIKSKMAAGLDRKSAVESAISQVTEDAAQLGVPLTPAQLSEFGAARQTLQATSDPISSGYSRVAGLTGAVMSKLSMKVQAALQKEINARMAAASASGLDIRTATLAALNQVEQDLLTYEGTPADLALVQSLRGGVEGDRQPVKAGRVLSAGETLTGVSNG